jgi:hypothetical protein
MADEFVWYGDFGTSTEDDFFENIDEEFEEEEDFFEVDEEYENMNEYFEINSDSDDGEEEDTNNLEDDSEEDKLEEDGGFSDEDAERVKDFNWKSKFIPLYRTAFDNRLSGHNCRYDLESSALELFQLFFTLSLVEHIVNCTNLYATYMISQYALDSEIRIKLEKNWYPVTKVEILAYLGTIFLSGLVQVKAWMEYFDNDPFTHQKSFTRVFSRERWLYIKRFLYFEDPNNISSHKLGKIITLYMTLQVYNNVYFQLMINRQIFINIGFLLQMLL